MIWSRLKSFKCPKCGTSLTHKPSALEYICPSQHCDFVIGTERFDELVKEKQASRYPQEMDNMSALNNLGREEMSDDFSDSPFLDR